MGHRISFDLDAAAADAIVRGLPGSPTLAGVTPLTGGGSELFRLELQDASPVVLKVYPDAPKWGPRKEVLVAGWMDGALDVPTPRLVRFDESRTLLPLVYAVFTWTAGSDLRSYFSAPDLEDAYRQMGALLRRVHRVPMPAYGYILDEGVSDPKPTNAIYMAGAIEGALRKFRSLGGDVGLARELEQILQGGMDLMAESAGPVLCHDDFHPGNLLFVREEAGRLRLSGLIDFGNARAGDALMDLAKALFCSKHEDPRSSVPLMEGYGPIDHSDPDRALWLYTLFHRVTMWNWLTALGADPGSPTGPGGLLRDLHEMARAS
ncbi:phosphotransferase family protein [Phenylobacterium terrae]|uniref:Phosphotransferase family protein n=1 Tax=Phenylobacterium terrae TaxID=2665495 RepID=A0ABW4MWQ0_9CAUL